MYFDAKKTPSMNISYKYISHISDTAWACSLTFSASIQVLIVHASGPPSGDKQEVHHF